MEMLLGLIVLLLCFFLLVFWVVYFSITQHYTYWKDRGVPHDTPSFPFGTFKDGFLEKLHIGEMYDKYYKIFKDDSYFGLYYVRRPILVVKDPELIKQILTKDFNHFTDRFVFNINKDTDYISNHLFNMTGWEWKKMRQKLTPTFTTGRMKMMFLLMLKCGEQLQDHIQLQIKINHVVDIKDVLARFTMDVIATCAFGLEINSLSNKDCEFYRYGIKIFKPTILSTIKRIFFTALPFMSKLMTDRFAPKDVSEFLTRIIRETVDYREKNNVNRNDFLDLLIQISQSESSWGEENHKNRNKEFESKRSSEKNGLTIEEMTAQCFIFFIAGFETASSTMTFCLYELACNPDIQERLHKEVVDVLAKHGGQPTYQCLQEMTYMDQVINETLRRYASLSTLNRGCTESYKVPNSNLVLEKGQRVTIPIFSIHHDPEYYPDPYKFDPDRFTPERVRERHPYLHLPFGEGPRMCIGMRFGLLQTKIGLTEMVSNFVFRLTPETPVPVTIHKRSFVTQPEKPIMLSVTKRNSSTLCT